MRVFEFYFSPEEKEDLIFESFCYEPENIYEKRMGGLFMLGELKRALPHNHKLLGKIASAVKKEFYSKFQRTHEQSLKESLKRANEFLSDEVSRENTDWLGNLNFTIISLKDFNLNFTKVGAVKLLLIRGTHIVDIGEKLDSDEIEPYPLKIFNNIASGRLGENDIILAITEGLFPAIRSTINEIAKIFPFDEKAVKESFRKKEKELADFPGAFILINAVKTPVLGRKPRIIFQKEMEKFTAVQKFLSLAEKNAKKTPAIIKKVPAGISVLWRGSKLISSFLTKRKDSGKAIPKPKTSPATIKVRVQIKTAKEKASESKIYFPKIGLKIPRLSLRIPAFRAPSFKIPEFKFARILTHIFRKKFSLFFLLFAILLLGFFIFHGQENQKLKDYQKILQSAENKATRAESLLLLQDTNPEIKTDANNLLLSALNEILPLSKIDSKIKKDAVSLKENIEKKLGDLNGLVKVENPELFFKFSRMDFIPQKMISAKNHLFFFSSFAQNLYEITESGESKIVRTNQKFNSAALISADSILFFSKPNTIIYFTPGSGQFGQVISLGSPYPNFNFSDLASFKGNIYLLESEADEIIKYPAPLENNKDNPQKWLLNNSVKPSGGKSIAVDGSVWILDSQNRLLRYYSGNLQETIKFGVFPEPKSFSKIFINPILPYIYALEPSQDRLMIFDKKGKIVKQFQSDSFGNLLDFSVSENGKTIWLLNGLEVYKISF